MTDAGKAVAEAKAEGRAEAEREAALRLAAAEFRVAAAVRIADPDAALELLDLSKLVKDGEPDRAAIAAAAERLAAVPPPAGHIPPGPRQPAAPNPGNDWVRQMSRAPR